MAPRDGTVFAPHRRLEPVVSPHSAVGWTGTPLEDGNRGAWIDEGTTIGWVGDDRRREAAIFVAQRHIDLVREGQHVSLLLPDVRRGVVGGQVVEIAKSPANSIPPELGSLTDERTTYYQVRVDLGAAADGMPVRVTGRARISVHNASTLSRLRRLFFATFG